MGKMFKVKMDIIDALDHIGAKIEFLGEACMGIGLKEDRMGEEAAFGAMLVFQELSGQLADINKVLYENIKQDKEITLEKIANVG